MDAREPITTDCGSILEKLGDDSVWNEYIERRRHVSPLDPRNDRFEELARDAECRFVSDMISKGSYSFSIPVKKLISKTNINKKRAVYTYTEHEMMSLRIIASLLNDYDHLFSVNLYSFRRNSGVKDAICRIKGIKNLDSKYIYKTDIHDYFNSIDVRLLLEDMRKEISDKPLLDLFSNLLTRKEVEFRGEMIVEKKGVMAGTPISPFLANYYLRDVDEHFHRMGMTYMRYADDILMIADNEEDLNQMRDELLSLISAKGLEVNPKKEAFYHPGETFEFLGFSINEKCIDISAHTLYKIKGKIRRSARSIRRWMLEKDAPINGTVRALIRRYNHKFYGVNGSDLSWAKWFLPVITTADSLHEIDAYFQDWIRFVATGKHNKKNYEKMTYEVMARCGYRPLVSEYYAQMNDD